MRGGSVEINNTLLDIQLVESEYITKELIGKFIWDISSRLGALLVYLPFVAHFPYNYAEVEKYLEMQERERKENSLMAKRMKEILVSRSSNVNGFSGIGLYEKSNCSVHIWPEQNFMSFDLSYFIPIDNKVVLECIKEYFQIDKITGISVSRKNGKQKVETIKE